MKRYLKVFAVLIASMAFSISAVNAEATSQRIGASICEAVYTNYYFMIEANDFNTMNNAQADLSSMVHKNQAVYKNNTYNIEFDENNIGYGQVAVSRNTTTSNDGITSISLMDFYKYYLEAANATNRIYTKGKSNYIDKTSYNKFENGEWVQSNTLGLNLTGYSATALANASIDSNVNIIRLDDIKYSTTKLVLEVTRNGYSNLTNKSINYKNNTWYLQPAMYYVQYCAKKTNNNESQNVVQYDANAGDAEVVDVPGNDYFNKNECTNISTLTPSREGYVFLGWSTNKNATTPENKYTPGKEYCGDSIKLYAIWQEIANDRYVIIYKPNTTDLVTNLPESDIKTVGENTIISTLVPVREGYTFLGWSTQEGATTPDHNYDGGTTYSDGKDLILYAVWKKSIPDNPKTGVENYILPFGGVALVSSLGIFILKKKKSYLQF